MAIEYRDTDVFKGLQFNRSAETPYFRHTLAPGSSPEQIYDRGRCSQLWATLSALQPDLVCCNGWSLPGSVETLRWSLLHRIPAILMADSKADDYPRTRLGEHVKSRVVSLSSAALVAGSRHREYVTSLGMPCERILTGYDVVDNQHFTEGAPILPAAITDPDAVGTYRRPSSLPQPALSPRRTWSASSTLMPSTAPRLAPASGVLSFSVTDPSPRKSVIPSGTMLWSAASSYPASKNTTSFPPTTV